MQPHLVTSLYTAADAKCSPMLQLTKVLGRAKEKEGRKIVEAMLVKVSTSSIMLL